MMTSKEILVAFFGQTPCLVELSEKTNKPFIIKRLPNQDYDILQYHGEGVFISENDQQELEMLFNIAERLGLQYRCIIIDNDNDVVDDMASDDGDFLQHHFVKRKVAFSLD